MKTLFTIIACSTLLCLKAQQIDAYRYWYDDDAANAVTTTVTASPELVLADNWPADQLSSGYHRVSVQVRDTEGVWSVPQTRLFTRVGQEITGYRFWVNDDIATLSTGTVGPNSVVDLNAVIDPGTLTKDYNLVTLQFTDDHGEWSVPQSTWFVKNTGAVNGYQYWIDDDIANLSSGTIGPAEVVDLIADLPTPTTNGDHLFTIRFSGVNGTWSVPLTTAFSFLTGTEELPGVSDLFLFPNPTDGMVALRLTSDMQRNMALSVLDAHGRQVLAVSNWAVNGTGTRSLDLSALPAGPYLLRITENDRSTTMRFVKR